MFYEAMEEVLPGVKLIIDDGSGDLNKTLYLDELLALLCSLHCLERLYDILRGRFCILHGKQGV